MASERVKAILRSKGAPFTDEDLERIPDSHGWLWIYEDKKAKKRTHGPEVCFTGFRAQEKDELAALAKSVGLHVVTAVTVRLTYLVVGATPGPAKLEQAAEQEVDVIDAAAFRAVAAMIGEVDRRQGRSDA